MYFHGRIEKAQIPTPLLDRLTQLFVNEETEQIFEQLFEEKEVILFGEGYGGNIQKVGKCKALMEGIVCRPEKELQNRLGERIIVKIKERDFKEV